MTSGAHVVLQTATGPFYIRSQPEGGLVTGWLDGLDAGMRRVLRTAPVGPVPPAELVERIARALAGEACGFEDVPLPPGTPFQRAVWRATREVPRGETRSYRLIAELVGHPGAARAVGQTMRRNPQPIVTPCHRVVGSGGLGGFGGQDAGGDRVLIKERLLDLERLAADRNANSPGSSKLVAK